MKKLFSYILLVAMCLSLFAGCADNNSTPAASEGLEKAKTYLYNLYKDLPENTAANFEVVGIVVIQGEGTYNVEWTATSDAITFTRNDKMVTVNIPTSPEAEINYTLTATITDGNGGSISVSFNHKVPAGGNLADGTYVILAGNLTMSSLPQDKSYGYPPFNEVTVADGKVSNHFKADVLTIKKVGDYYTIQDAYGRYFYLKGSYNSFNVDATMPEEGHLFNIGREGDGFIITNTLNQKTLAYSTSYNSWGCYPELAEDHQHILTILPATAPEKDPETPDNPSNPSNPSTPSTPSTGMITNPVPGTPYKLALNQAGLGKTLYFTGVEKPNYPWYIQSAETESGAIDVYVEKVSGGLRLYFTINGTKTYLDMHKDGTHYSLRLTTTPTAVYTWNTEHNTFVATVEDAECFIGTSGTFNTFSCNQLSKVSTSYVAHLYGEGGTTEPTTPTTPTTPTQPSNPSTPSADNTAISKPVAGTPYKMVIHQNGLGKVLYFTGTEKTNYPWYINSGATPADGVDVYLEAVTGGYRLYFTVGGTKTYLDMYKDGTHYSLKLTTTPTTVYTWNDQYKTLVAMNEDAECFIGTSGTFNTFSCNQMSKVSTSYVAHLYPKGVTAPVEPTTGSSPSQPSNPSTPSGNTLPPVTAPKAGTTYKFGMIQVKTGNTVYIDGSINQDRFLTTTTDKSKALDVTVEASGDGYKFAVTINGTKQYITAGMNSAGKTALSYSATGSVFKFQSDISSWVTSIDGTDYYIGSYSTFDTMSVSKTSYINATNKGVDQFPAGFFN